MGCYKDVKSDNLLFPNKHRSMDVSPGYCKKYCEGYKFMSIQSAEFCRCGDKKPLILYKVEDEQCNLPCVGDSTQICGGSYRQKVYEITKSKSKILFSNL